MANTGQKFIYTGFARGRVVIYDMLTGKEVRGGDDDSVMIPSAKKIRGQKITVNWQKMHFNGQNRKKCRKRTLIIFQFYMKICPPTFSRGPLG